MTIKKYELPPLSYVYNALEPYIDAETMKIHHDKHHAAYVNNLNVAIEKYLFEPDGSQSRRADLFSKSAEELITHLNDIPEEIRTAVRNNAGGHINHSMFWQSMASPAEALAKAGPSGVLADEINKTFGSFEDFKTKFNDAGLKRFGSGWVWLAQTTNGKLDIVSTQNQDNPIMDGHKPILGNDVWEHAYYLKYKNMRADYLKAWWNVVNWQEVEKRFESR